MVVRLNTAVIYCGTAVIYCGILTLENVDTALNCQGIFVTLVHDGILKYCGNLLGCHGNLLWYFNNHRKCEYCGKLLRYFYNIGTKEALTTEKG